jgi:transcription antitermination factor NusG
MAAACAKSNLNGIGAMTMNWFALNVKSRQEQKVADSLSQKGYEVFLPVYKSRRFWSDRVKELDLPLFPGYVFCKFDLQSRVAPVVTTQGLIRIVGVGPVPYPVDAQEIEVVRQIASARLQTGPWPYLQQGSRVQIRRGPLAGIEGIVVNLKSQTHVIVSVTLLSRSVAVTVDPAWLVPDGQERFGAGLERVSGEVSRSFRVA